MLADIFLFYILLSATLQHNHK